MKNICVIGALGRLGKALMKMPNTIACPWMFENDSSVILDWFNDNPQVNTVWHVARSCRTVGIRRDQETFLSEQKGMMNLLRSRAKDCRFVYASSKIVYGLGGVSDNPDEVLSADDVAKHFTDNLIGTFNCPVWQPTDKINITNLDTQRTIYACTKLSNEQMIRQNCPNHKIIRIWDIL